MKKQFKNRKAFEQIARELGFQDQTHHVVFKDQITQKESLLLVNNFNRFVKGMLMLSPMEQVEKLQQFRANMEDLLKAQKEAKEEAQESIKNVKIQDPLTKTLEETANGVSNDPFKF